MPDDPLSATPVVPGLLGASVVPSDAGLYPLSGPVNYFTIIDAAGDLIIGTADDVAARLPIGVNGQMLTVSAGLPAWQPAPAGLPADTVVAAATRIIANMLAAGDTQPAWRVLGNGQMDWGPGGTTSIDVTLQRTGSGTLQLGNTTQLGRLNIRNSGNNLVLASYVAAEVQARFFTRADGLMSWGDGTNPQDVTLARGVANWLFLGTTAQRGALRIYGSAGTIDIRQGADANSRWSIDAAGLMQWGDGTNPQDTTLARFAANELAFGTGSQWNALRIYADIANRIALRTFIAAEGNPRLVFRSHGVIEWGPGNAATDTFVSRGGAGILFVGSPTQKSGLRTYGAAATDNAAEAFVTTDANSRWFVRADGQMQWGPGNAAQDTTLWRGGVGRLYLGNSGQKGWLQAYGSIAGDYCFSTVVGSDAQQRLIIFASGQMQWGDGTNPQDVTLIRAAAGILQLGTPSQKGRINFFTDATSTALWAGFVTTDSQARIVVRGSGQIEWGPGVAASTDVTLYRSAQDVLKTDDSFQAALNLAVGSALSLGGGAGVIGIQNAVTNPSTNPAGGGVLYVSAGALMYRGSSGSVTTLAPA